MPTRIETRDATEPNAVLTRVSGFIGDPTTAGDLFDKGKNVGRGVC